MLKPCEVCKNKQKSEFCQCRKWQEWFCIEWRAIRAYFFPAIELTDAEQESDNE